MTDHSQTTVVAMTGKVLVQIRLPKAMVKEIDHRRIDLGISRTEFIERIMREWLQDQSPLDQPVRPIEDLLGALPDLTGGLSAVDYVRRVRRGTS